MKRKKYRSIITMITILFFLSWLSEKNIPLSAQEGDGIDSIAKQNIQHLFIQLRKADNDTIKLRINEEIKLQLSKILKDDKSFNDALDSLTLLGKLYAPDTTFRILNWNVALSEGTYLYTLILQIHDTVTGETQVRVLEKNRLKEPVYQIADSLVLSPEHWYGALYYDILQTRTDTGTCWVWILMICLPVGRLLMCCGLTKREHHFSGCLYFIMRIIQGTVQYLNFLHMSACCCDSIRT